jgi:hypothetical protein
LLQIREFFLLKLQSTMGYIVSPESSLELILGDSTNVLVRVTVRLPPMGSCPKQLMCCKKYFLMIVALDNL